MNKNYMEENNNLKSYLTITRIGLLMSIMYLTHLNLGTLISFCFVPQVFIKAGKGLIHPHARP